MAQLVLENVLKMYRCENRREVKALDQVSLTVENGEFLVLVGPSGSGKTTLLRLIAGLETVSQGSIFLDGQACNDLPPRHRDVAMVFQNHALYPHMTAFENMALGLKLKRLPRAEIEARITSASRLLGIEACLSRKPKALSGGQRQRVALGRAMVKRPRVFLLDEPLSHLDAPLRRQMRGEISRLHQRLGATLVYVTHDQQEAMALGHRLAVINEGRVQQVAKPGVIYQKPANLFVAKFIGSPPINLFKGVLIRDQESMQFRFTGGGPVSESPVTLPIPSALVSRWGKLAGQELVLGVRPECLFPQRKSPASGPVITAKLERVEPLGADTHLDLSMKGHPLTARVPASFQVEAGGEIALRVDLAAACCFDPNTGRALE